MTTKTPREVINVALYDVGALHDDCNADWILSALTAAGYTVEKDAEIAALKAERDRLREALSGMRNLLKPVRAITAHEVGALVGIIDGALSPTKQES